MSAALLTDEVVEIAARRGLYHRKDFMAGVRFAEATLGIVTTAPNASSTLLALPVRTYDDLKRKPTVKHVPSDDTEGGAA